MTSRACSLSAGANSDICSLAVAQWCIQTNSPAIATEKKIASSSTCPPIFLTSPTADPDGRGGSMLASLVPLRQRVFSSSRSRRARPFCTCVCVRARACVFWVCLCVFVCVCVYMNIASGFLYLKILHCVFFFVGKRHRPTVRACAKALRSVDIEP